MEQLKEGTIVRLKDFTDIEHWRIGNHPHVMARAGDIGVVQAYQYKYIIVMWFRSGQETVGWAMDMLEIVEDSDADDA